MAQVGNWGGRRPGAGRKSLRDEKVMAQVVSQAVPQTEQLEILKAMVERAKQGDTRAAALVLNYTYGRPLPLREDNCVTEARELRALDAIHGWKCQLRYKGIDVDADLPPDNGTEAAPG